MQTFFILLSAASAITSIIFVWSVWGYKTAQGWRHMQSLELIVICSFALGLIILLWFLYAYLSGNYKAMYIAISILILLAVPYLVIGL